MLREVHAVLVVRGEEDLVVRGHLRNDNFHVLVEALVRSLNVIEHRRLNALLCGKLALFVHIGASNHFDTKVVPKDFGSFYFHGYDTLHSLEVVLVAVHDHHFLTDVQMVCHLLAKGFNSCLNISLFSVDVKKTIPITCEV